MEQAKKYAKDFVDGTVTIFKEFFNKNTRKKQVANMISFSRLLITLPILILSIIAMITASAPLLITNSILVGLGAFTDAIDGPIARKFGYTSEYGKKLDQITDKTFSFVAAGTLLFINPIFILPILGESLIMASTLPFTLKHKNVKDHSEMIGKIKQWPLGVSFLLGYISPLNATINLITMILVAITFELQMGSTITYLKRNIKSIGQTKKENNDILLTQIQDLDKTNELEKNIGEKKNTPNCNENNIKQAKKNLCKELKELRNELTNTPDENLDKTKIKK